MWMKSLKDEDYVPERWGLKGLKGTWGLSPQNMWIKIDGKRNFKWPSHAKMAWLG